MDRIKLLSLVLLIGLFSFSPNVAAAVPNFPALNLVPHLNVTNLDRPKYSPDEVIVTFKTGKVDLANPGLLTFFREFNTRFANNLTKSDVLESGNIAIYKIKDGRSVQQVINEVKSDSNVQSVEPNFYIYPSDLGTSDSLKDSLWGLNNFGQTITFDNGTTTTGTSGSDIKMAQAWGVSVGTTDVIVAVIDSGVAYNHPDLINNMWDGTNCVDETGTPIIGGCLHGYDYYATSGGDNDPLPDSSTHGTHVAGTIAATRNNGIGIAGVGPNIKIMALKFGFDTVSEVKAIDFAIQNGAKVINASYGSNSFSAAELAAITRFRDAGGIFVAAAGNDGTNNDVTIHVYPSDYDLDNIISVAATDNQDSLATFSDYGTSSVDVAAPGVDILSTVTYKQDYYETLSAPFDITAGAGSYWGIVSLAGGGKALVGDTNAVFGPNYLNNSDYYITSDPIALSVAGTSPTSFTFDAVCGDVGTTLGDNSATGDYMALDLSSDGVGFTEVARWNQSSMSALASSVCDGSSCFNVFTVGVTTAYLNDNFKYRFHWVTDSSSNSSPGCYMYDIKIIDYPPTGSSAGYDFLQGTSMAAPHVAGLAGYLWTVNPSATYSQVVTNILANGDTLPSLAGKILTGMRINAYNSVLNIGSTITPSNTPTPTPTPTGSTPTDTPTPTPTPTGSITPSDTPTPTQTPAPSQNNNNSPPGPPACNDKSPKIGPDLFYIKTEKGKATIYFSPTAEKTTGYAVIYGLKKGDERYGYVGDFKTNNEGVQNLTIGALNPKTTYYFKVAGINKCDITPWSEWVPAKPDRVRNIYKYKTIIVNRIRTLISLFK